MSWKTLGAVLPGELAEARLQLHWAAQLLSAPGSSLLAAAEDFSHTNLGWDSELGLLSGRSVGPDSLGAGLVFESLDLVLIDGQRERSSMRLAGRTPQEALAWLNKQLAAKDGSLSLPTHDMPSHALARGGLFSEANSESRAELAAWFSNSFDLLGELVADQENASPVRCWPHHFDVASLITLDPGAAVEEARSIGVGFSPGDGSYDQPYFYVTPWPYPKTDALPDLDSPARWHTEGWTGAVVTVEQLISLPAAEQHRRVRQALQQALAASAELLGA